MTRSVSLLTAGLLVLSASSVGAVVAPSMSTQAEIPLPTDAPSGVVHADVQASMSEASGGLQRLSSQYGGWTVPIWDEKTGSPVRAAGEPIAIVGAGVSGSDTEMAGRAFIDANSDLFNVTSDDLVFIDARVRRGVTYLFFQQTVDGVAIDNASVHLRIDADGRVTAFGSNAHPDVSVSTAPAVTAEQAKNFAVAGLTLDDDSVITNEGLVIMPVEWEDAYGYFLTHRVEIASTDGGYTAHVNAATGDILQRKSHELNIDIIGNLEGDVPVGDSPVGPFTNKPMGFSRVDELATTTTDVTDENGDFSISWGGSTPTDVRTRMSVGNSHFNLFNNGGAEAQLIETVTPGNFATLVWDNTNSLLEERASHQALNEQRYDLLQLDPGFPFGLNFVTAFANYSGSCNAQWTGTTIRLFAAGGGCISLGRIPSVGNHEYGHGLTDWIYSPFSESCAMIEGLPDIRAHNHTGVPTIGTGWRGGTTFIRTGENTRTWGQILNICPGNVYSNGDCHCKADVTMGAVWKSRVNLMETHGAVVGEQIIEDISHYSLYQRPQTPQQYIIDILLEDDDDGNLNNGTPNYGDICEAFEFHEIPCPAITEYLEITHAPLGDTVDESNPYTVAATIIGVNETVDNSQVFVTYRVSGGSWQSVPMTNTAGSSYEGDIPAQAADNYVDYYITAAGLGGAVASDPEGAPNDLHAFIIGTLVTVLDDDMESDAGWITDPGGSDTASDGFWVLDNPNGTIFPPDEPANPEDDNTPGAGVQCWFTGQGDPGGSVNAADVDGGCTSIDSPTFNLAGYSFARVSFDGWFFNSVPDSDALTFSMSTDGGASFTELWNVMGRENSWNRTSIDLRAIDVPFTTSVVFRFTACDEAGGGTVEAAVDEFLLGRLSGDIVGVDESGAPAAFAVHANRPNPFNPQTTLSYDVPAATDVAVRIYNVSGQLVRTLVDERVSAAGSYAVTWDGNDAYGKAVASGTYYYEVRAGAEVQKRKMTLLK